MPSLQLPYLTHLDISWCARVSDIGVKALQSLSALSSLNINGCTLVSEAGLASLSKHTSLQYLNACNCGSGRVAITDACMAKLTALGHLTELQVKIRISLHASCRLDCLYILICICCSVPRYHH